MTRPTLADVPRLTRQGVRDLGGGRPRRAQVAKSVCRHVWDDEMELDCHVGMYRAIKRCGFCGEVIR